MREEEIIAFIESGELEAYLLGALSLDDEKRVEGMIQAEPQIRSHFESLEEDLETIAQRFKEKPPAGLKGQILNAIPDAENARPEEGKEAVIIPMTERKSRLNVAAALIVLILGGFLAWNMYQSTQLENQRAQFQLETELQSALISELQKQQNDLLAQNALMSDPQTQKVLLTKGAQSDPLFVAAFWNEQRQEAMVHSADLPELPKDKCYQLWADVDGEMLSVGILEPTSAPVAVNFYADATSLNITVEKAGGSDHATVANLVTNAVL